MKIETYTLPSTAKIDLRQLTLAEENYLNNNRRRGGRQYRLLADVLASCTERVADPGPYSFLAADSKITADQWMHMMFGDMFAAIIYLRCLSYRDGRTAMVENIRCGTHQFSCDIDLLSDLSVHDLDPKAAELLKAGESFTLTIRGKKAKCRFATALQAERADELEEQNGEKYGVVTARIAAVIQELEGVDRSKLLDLLNGKLDEPALTSDECEEFRDGLDQFDCGVDMDVMITCPKCAAELAYSLPFEQAAFMPSKGIQERRSKRRKDGRTMAGPRTQTPSGEASSES
jgi:hypothetical protein